MQYAFTSTSIINPHIVMASSSSCSSIQLASSSSCSSNRGASSSGSKPTVRFHGPSNTSLLMAFSLGVFTAKKVRMSDSHARGITNMLPPPGGLDFMAPLDQNNSATTATLHPSFVHACWQYEVNMCLYMASEMYASFELDASFATVHLMLTGDGCWHSCMPSSMTAASRKLATTMFARLLAGKRVQVCHEADEPSDEPSDESVGEPYEVPSDGLVHMDTREAEARMFKDEELGWRMVAEEAEQLAREMRAREALILSDAETARLMANWY